MISSLMNVGSVLLPRKLAEEGHRHLAAVGRQGLEGMALWAGSLNGEVCTIGEVIIPKQQGLRTEHGLAVTVSGEELHRINMHLFGSKLRLIAQIHSHPGRAYHSAMDDAYAIATALGSLSLVVPDFAEEPFDVRRCATYRLLPPRWWQGGSSRWTQVSASKAAAMIRIVE